MDDNDTGRPRPREVEVPGLSPVRAFFVVCAIATALGGAIFATRDAAPSEPPRGPAPSPDYSLTNAEAIEEFERLNELQVQAYEQRDLSLVPRTYTSGSPVRSRVEEEITSMLRRDVTTSTRFRTKRVVVVTNEADELVLNQTALIDASFFDSLGREISLDAPAEIQEIKWTLRMENNEWLIHDVEIIKSHPIR